MAGDVRMTDTRADEAERSRRRRQFHEDEGEVEASAGGEETGAGGEAVGVVVGAGTVES